MKCHDMKLNGKLEKDKTNWKKILDLIICVKLIFHFKKPPHELIRQLKSIVVEYKADKRKFVRVYMCDSV